MSRNARDNFEISPRIKDLQLILPRGGKVASLGMVDGLLEITDPSVNLKKLRLTRRDARLEITGAVLQQTRAPLEGEMHFSLNDGSVGLKDYVALALYGTARLGGRLGAPEFSGSLSIPSAQPFSFRAPTPFNQEFVELKGALDLKWNEKEPLFTLRDVETSGPGIQAYFERPVTFDSEGIRGSLVFKIDRLAFNQASFESVTVGVDVSHNWTVPSFGLTYSANDLIIVGKSLGKVSGQGIYDGEKITFDAASTPLSESLPFLFTAKGAFDVLNDFALLPTRLAAQPSSTGSAWALSGNATVAGPLDLAQLEGNGEFSLLAGTSSVPGSLELSGGLLKASGRSDSSDMKLQSTIPIGIEREGSVEIIVNHLNFLKSAPQGHENRSCSTASGVLTYRFPPSSLLLGSGTLALSEMVAGCAPVTLALKNPTELKINSGTLEIPQIVFTNEASSVIAQGKINLVSGFDLSLKGGLEFQALAPLIGAVDDVQGTVALNANVSGPLAAPLLRGAVSVENAALELESSGMSIRNLEGTLTIADDGLEFSSVRGRLNDGKFTLSGRIEPLAFERSVATMTFDEVFLEPLPEMTAIVSGTLGIGPDRNGTSAISGVITVNSAEFKRTTSIGEMLQSTARSLFSGSRSSPAFPDAADLPSLPIDLKVTAPGNILVDTTWGAGELRGDLTVKGTLRDPQPEGQISVVSGWVGLRDRRFELTNGTITFTPPSLDPVLDVLAETTIRSRQGDLILVLLEVRGNASAPRLKLNSDRGLNEREILNLFTAPGDSATTSRSSSMPGGIEVDALEFIEDRSFLGLGRLVRDLARIDSLSLEPTFNAQRGVVEPTLVATKRLFDHLSVVGETPLSGGQSNSRLRLMFDFSPAIEISGIVDTQSRDRNSSLGFDVGYTLLGERRRFLDIRFSGNRMFRGADIENAIRLTQDSRITEQDLPRLEKRISSFYREQGFFDTTAKATCESVPGFSDAYCHQLRVALDEGRPSYIEKVTFSGESFPDAAIAQQVERRSMKSVASEATRKDFEQALIQKLRSEGYLSARVDTSYHQLTKDGSRLEQELVTEVTIGNPVTFVFVGNKVFSPADFLQTIDLSGRKQPFGNNTIAILLRNIVRLYSERGYLNASPSFLRRRDEESGRLTFTVTIEEGQQFQVDEVSLQGLKAVSAEEVRATLEGSDSQAALVLFSPRYAVADQLEANTQTLARTLVEMGFPDVRISVEATAHPESSLVSVAYLIAEGERQLVRSVIMEGAPVEVSLPALPKLPSAIPEINRYTQELSRTLAEAGYQEASIGVSFTSDVHTIQLSISPGTVQRIGEISIEGNSSIETPTIQSELLVSTGSAFRNDLIQESKRRLLRLGLFNRVDITNEPISLPEGTVRVTVRVQERSLQTLSLGGGANSELGLHLFGEATDRSFFRDGRSFTARLDTYYDRVATTISQGIASLTYADPSLLGSSAGYVSDLRFQRLDLSTQEFNLDRVSLANYIHRSWEDGTTVSLGHTILSENLANVSPGAIVGPFDTGTVRLSFLSGVITLDERDDPLNPTRGYAASLDSLIASQALGSDADYGGGTARFSFLTPLSLISPRWSFASNSRTGALWTFGNTGVVPISQRFYLGGRNSVRGFRENSLGPRGDDGAIQGGDFFVSQNLELRYLLSENIALLSFLDVGGLYFMDQIVSTDDLRESTGLGIRYLSPIGPVGFDLGVPLDERPGEPSFRIHFSIGTNF